MNITNTVASGVVVSAQANKVAPVSCKRMARVVNSEVKRTREASFFVDRKSLVLGEDLLSS